MSTIRLGPSAKPQSIYSGQQKPNATAETLTSLNERVIRDPSRIVGWSEIGEDPYSGADAYAGLYVDVSQLSDLESVGRIGVFDIDEDAVAGRVGLYVTMRPNDKVMAPANVIDGSVVFFGGINLEATSPAKIALPGSFIRNDAYGFLAGRDVYADWETPGIFRQDDPPTGVSRFKVGQALDAHILYFNPDTHYMCDDGDFTSLLAYSLSDATETITAFCIYEYDTGLYAIAIGTDKGRILVSWDRGTTYGVRVNLGAGYQVNDFCAFGGYLYACVSNSGGFLLYRSSDAYTWGLSHTNATGDTDAMSLCVFGSYLLVGSHGSGYAKIWSTTDGATLTKRYESGTESTFCRLANDGTYAHALIGGTTARQVASLSGTSWTIYNNYTGFSEADDLISLDGTTYSLVSDGSNNGMMYSGITTSVGTSEYNPVGKPNGFLVHDGSLYLCGGNVAGSASGYGLTKRTGAATWELIGSVRGTGYCRRSASLPNGYTYFIGGPLASGVYKIPSLQVFAS